jgi:c-di-GMP-binding flagellar brake protein YcgR
MNWEGTEKRRFVRAYLSCRIIVHTPQKDTIDTVSNNISEGGLGFTLKEELENFSIVDLEIYDIKKRPIVCKGMVRWVKTIESSLHKGRFLFNTGIEFYKIRAKDKLAIINFIASIACDKK